MSRLAGLARGQTVLERGWQEPCQRVGSEKETASQGARSQGAPVTLAGFLVAAAIAMIRWFEGLLFSRQERHMAYTVILLRIRLLIPSDLDGHYKAVCRGFDEGDLTAPSLSISEMQLARAISEFISLPPNEASIATLERRLNPQY